ncbi:hypothetical protein AB4Z43_01520 [Mesorhizobium sp. 2RAF45]|uniref:hypothetical protein n=1 Tax=Mesorhizobium sp. 2RAF45 TaxID=3233001 RepID=UPI003F9E79E9
MAQLNDEIRDIMVQSRAERQALFEPISELSRRLQPRHLVEVTTNYAKQKVANVVGGVSDAIKDNGGTAAAVALGAVAVFDAGRRSSHGGADVEEAPKNFGSGEHADAASIRYSAPPNRAVTNLDRGKALAASAGGLLIGRAIGQAFEPTDKERSLFGKAGAEVQTAAAEFVRQHSHGAKVAAAQAFGFARYSAAFLAIMAAMSDYMRKPDDGSNT